MYSVIIQSSKTYESFLQYRPLFAEALNLKKVGVCRWVESGTTLENALPGLSELTEDKESWRAIIVRYEDDECMSGFESAAQNPYDFAVSHETNTDEIRESPVPLIRLTQMLGGVPAPNLGFEAQIVQEDNKAPRTIYVPVPPSAENVERHKILEAKYRYNGILPSSILLVTLRKDFTIPDESISDIWMSHKESASSEFWKHNHYPSVCRFMAYDAQSRGGVQKDADDFNFWSSVLLISLNVIDSATLQAYRLYRVKTLVDKESMEQSFQTQISRLNDAKHTLESGIKREIERGLDSEEKLPDYRLDTAVVLRLPKGESRRVRLSSFPVLPSSVYTDLTSWDTQKRHIENELEISVRAAGRSLDQTAERLRGNCGFAPEEVEFLSKYQKEDLSREVDELYHSVVSIQGELPTGQTSDDEEIKNTEDAIVHKLAGRVTKRPAALAAVIAAASIFAVMIPAFIRLLKGVQGNLLVIVIVLAALIVITLFCGALVLMIQKGKLNKLIRLYNQLMNGMFNRISDNAKLYSDYMSAIASHARGSSYLQLSDRKQTVLDKNQNSRYHHLRMIEQMLGKIKRWSRAYHLDLEYSTSRPDSWIELDLDQSPDESKLYYFGNETTYPVELNRSGLTIQSPFAYLKKLEIVREELYDDELY